MVNYKKAVSSLWNDKLTIIEFAEVINDNGSTGFKQVTTLKDEPCKLSFNTISNVNQSDVGVINQTIKIFCDSDIVVKPGSKIIVNRNNKDYHYKQSGNPSLFSFHQEIHLVLEEEYS